MFMDSFIKTGLTIISGGATWELFKFFFPDVQRIFESRIAAKKTLYKNIDPILKSASELFGKLESLSKEDFSTFVNPDKSNSLHPEHNRKYIYFLFAQFWAHLEFIRIESQSIALSKIKKGNQLLRFIEVIESRKYRILDRSIQRIIGECLITNKDQKFRIMTLNEFISEVDNPLSNLAKWITLLENVLLSVNDKDKRQAILRFGVIIAALIEHFDPEYRLVRKRSLYTNKLSTKSKKMIHNHLLNHYLPFMNSNFGYI